MQGEKGDVIKFPEGGRQDIIDRLVEERNKLRVDLAQLRADSSKENIAQQKELEIKIRDLDIEISDQWDALGGSGKPKHPEADDPDQDDDPPKRAI